MQEQGGRLTKRARQRGYPVFRVNMPVYSYSNLIVLLALTPEIAPQQNLHET